MSRPSHVARFAFAWLSILGVSALPAGAQGPLGTAFTYQGQLTSTGVPATGPFDFEFKLFDALTVGAQVGSTVTVNDLIVTTGLFTTKLDFGPAAFGGSARFLEIGVRPGASSGSYTLLGTRQELTPSPNSVFASTAGSVSGIVSVANGGTGSASQNFVDLTTAQTVGGTKTLTGNLVLGASTLSAGNIMKGGTPFIHSFGEDNTFIGENAGNFTMTGSSNTANGKFALQYNTTGTRNTANGASALNANTTGGGNTASGFLALWNNTTGVHNTANGTNSLQSNTTGFNNTASGASALLANTTGSNNTASGFGALENNTAGLNNTASGWGALENNNTGSANTALGYFANVASGALSNATAIGANASVALSNSLVLGNGANVGIGTSAPNFKLHVVGENVRVEGNSASVLPRFSLNFTGGGVDQKKWQNYATTSTLVFSALNDAEGSETGWLEVNRGAGTAIAGVEFPNGTVAIATLGSAGATALCRNASNQISTCSSSARYKSNINSFRSGLSLIKQLRPVSFNWKDSGMSDMGLVAEEVNAVEPLLTTTNAKGEVEGVKYDRVGVVLVNAIAEQQAQVEEQERRSEAQRAKIEVLEKQVELLMKMACSQVVKKEGCLGVVTPK